MKAKRKGECPIVAGVANMGERGQIVIPKEVRESLKLKTGEAFFVMVHNDAVIFMPKKKMENFVKQLTATFDI